MENAAILECMTNELVAWYKTQGLEEACAQEQLMFNGDLNAYQRDYLDAFVDRWNSFDI